MNKMKRRLILLIILLLAMSLPNAKSQSEVTPISLTLTTYTDGTTKVDYHLYSDPTKVRIETELFGDQINSLVVRDEEGNPLQAYVTNNSVQVDTIGVLELHFSYLTPSLTVENDFIWVSNVTSPVNVTFILPKNANFLDLSEIPIEIGSLWDSQYLKFPPGSQYVYYILGLPSLIQEADTSITRSSEYILEKQSQGYILTGAVELLASANFYYDSEEYLEAKNKADEALIIASDIVDFADDAEFAINAAESSIFEARSQGRTTGLEAAESTLEEAKSLYLDGLYRNSEIMALQAAEEASTAEKPEQNNLVFIGLGSIVVLGALWLMRDKLGF